MENIIPVKALFEKYLTWCKAHRAPRSLEWYDGHLKNFLAFLKDNSSLPATDLKPFHIVEWIDSHPTWGDTYRGGAIVAVKRVYNWAEELGYLDLNPIKKLKKPQSKRRENPMSPVDFQRLMRCLGSDDPFGDFLKFIWHTGCRPQEARHIEPRHINLERQCIILPKEEAKGKRKPRVIHLNDVAFEIIQRLMDTPHKVFRNARGEPWTKYAVCNRMHRLSKLIDKKLAAYDARHGFATRKLIAGHGHLTIAALMGHTDGSMIAKVYSHIDKDDDHLKKALVN